MANRTRRWSRDTASTCHPAKLQTRVSRLAAVSPSGACTPKQVDHRRCRQSRRRPARSSSCHALKPHRGPRGPGRASEWASAQFGATERLPLPVIRDLDPARGAPERTGKTMRAPTASSPRSSAIGRPQRVRPAHGQPDGHSTDPLSMCVVHVDIDQLTTIVGTLREEGSDTTTIEAKKAAGGVPSDLAGTD
jgi:hypothetical protein